MSVNSFNAQNPPVTTKGDVFTFSTIPTRLGVGANNTVLTADSSTATGLKWATVSAGGISWTEITNGSLSGSAVNLTSLSGYDKYLLTIYTMSLSGDSFMSIKLNDATTNYRTLGFQQTSNVNSTSRAAEINMAAAASTANISFLVEGCLSSTGYKNYFSTGFASQATVGGAAQSGIYRSNTAITQINIVTSDTFDGGTYYLYGSN